MPTVEALIKGYGPNFPPLVELFGLQAGEEDLDELLAEIPELGRYRESVEFLRHVTSGYAVGVTRFRVIIERFIALGEELDKYGGIHADHKVVHSLTEADKAALRGLVSGANDIVRAQRIERFTEHDTAAAGDYLKLLIGTQMPHLEPMVEGICFADTSEDTMGPVFGLVLNSLVFGHFVPCLLDFTTLLLDFVDHVEKDGPLVLPAMTHEQAAEPTTFGKKMLTNLLAVFAHLGRMFDRDGAIPFGGKYGGAVGNLTTHFAAYPDLDWKEFARQFVEERLGLSYNDMSFQAATFDLEISYFTEIGHMMTHLIKLADDFIKMASCPAQFFIKRKVKGRKGSSIMPNKSNAWGMEGALEMLRLTRVELFHLAQTLPEYPHEGNMGRSYLLRRIGGVMMPAFIAFDRISSEMVGDMATSGYTPNHQKIAAFFSEYPGMAGSSIQTILKREGIAGDAYRLVEGIAINPDGSYANGTEFRKGLERVMDELELSDTVRDELRQKLEPRRNIGDAARLAVSYKTLLRRSILGYRKACECHMQPLTSSITTC